MRDTATTRRKVLKGAAAASAFAGVTILAARKTLAQRKQKLVYWHVPIVTPLADDAVRAQFEEFRKMAGLSESEAAFVPTPQQELAARLAAAFETNTQPDLVRLAEDEVQRYRAGGHLLETTDVVARMQAEKGGIFESSLTPIGHGGACWAVPYAINPWAVHARLDLLEEHGLDFPATWDAFVEACLRIQSPHLSGFGMDLGLTTDATANIMQVCWGFGGRTFDADGAPAFDHPGNVAGFALIDAMYSEHHIIPRSVIGNSDPAWNNKVYQSGEVAFISNVTSVFAYLSGENPELMARTGLFCLPSGPAGIVNQIGVWSLGLFNRSSYPDLAKGLAAYLMQPTLYNEVIINTNGRFVPVYPELFNDPWWTARPQFGQLAEIARTGVPISHAGPPSAAAAEVLAANLIPEAMQTVLVDGVEPAEAVADAHARIVAIHERLKR